MHDVWLMLFPPHLRLDIIVPPINASNIVINQRQPSQFKIKTLLNDDKTEFIIIGSPCNLKKVVTEYIVVCDHKIFKSKQVRNIGAIFDTSATMEAQVVKTAQTAWYHLYSISKIHPYLTVEQTRCVIHAYVTSRLDQNNSQLSGVPETTLLYKLQQVQKAAAKLILGGRKRDMQHHSFKNCTGSPCPNVTSSKQFCWYSKHCKEMALRICRIFLSPTREADDITRLDEPATQYKTFGDPSACLAPRCGICYLRTSGCPLQLLHSKLPLKPIFFKIAYEHFSP